MIIYDFIYDHIHAIAEMTRVA